MLLAYPEITLSCCFTLYLIPIICGFYSYRANSKRKDDDPKKRKYSRYAPWITPITFPIMVLVSVFVLIIESLLGAAFLIIFPICLILFRKLPQKEFFITKWMQKLGNFILRFNTEMLRTVGLYSPSG